MEFLYGIFPKAKADKVKYQRFTIKLFLFLTIWNISWYFLRFRHFPSFIVVRPQREEGEESIKQVSKKFSMILSKFIITQNIGRIIIKTILDLIRISNFVTFFSISFFVILILFNLCPTMVFHIYFFICSLLFMYLY